MCREGHTSSQPSCDSLGARDAQVRRRGLGHAHGAGRKGPYTLPYHRGGCGVRGDCAAWFQLPAVSEEAAVVMSLKRFPDKCTLTIAAVAGPITAPAAPKLRGLSAERVNRTPLGGTVLDTPNTNAAIDFCLFHHHHSFSRPTVFRDNYNSHVVSSLTACS